MLALDKPATQEHLRDLQPKVVDGDRRMAKITGIVWAKHSNRLDEITSSVGGRAVKIALWSGRKWLAPVRYLYLGFKTGRIISREKADVVIAQNPPVFCALFAHWSAKIHGCRLIIDSHSMARDRAGNGLLLWLMDRVERHVMKRAFLNTVIHDGYSKRLSRLGISSLVLLDMPPNFKVEAEKDKRFLVVCPLGGHPDEDIDSVFRVADAVKGCEIVLTGKVKAARQHPRVNYAGFLPKDAYEKQLLMSKVGLCLLKNNEMTLPYVLFEFASAELPFLVSRTETTEMLGDSFLVGGEEELVRKLTELTDEMNYEVAVGRVRELKKELLRKSNEGRERLRKILDTKA